MIICPNCKEEIDDDSHFCDQCGQALLYCNHCGRVGIGRRCIHCGGLMVSIEEYQRSVGSQTALSMSEFSGVISNSTGIQTTSSQRPNMMPMPSQGLPTLTLYNPNLNIRIQGINGAVIGRRQGPYSQFFERNMYISGVHAQLMYNARTGWCVVDKHSSNGTMLNQHPLQPDVEMSLKTGDILSLANVNLQVSIN
jgi:hypothetical protein